MGTAVVSARSISDGISRCTGPGIAPVAARIAPRSMSDARSGRATILFHRVTEVCSGSWSNSWYSYRSLDGVRIEVVNEMTGLIDQ